VQRRLVAHWATRGQRDFSSVQALEAERYAVVVGNQHLEEARRLSNRQPQTEGSQWTSWR
jgi:hypothetical protein